MRQMPFAFKGLIPYRNFMQFWTSFLLAILMLSVLKISTLIIHAVVGAAG
jgi:hypothetical protein